MSKSNRQKAGVKSASSHMAADLLSHGNMVTFDIFSGGATSMIDTEDAVSIKKLAKRDSSTREKALRELIDRCTEENANTVSSTFFNFSSIFERIIFDPSPIVRQLAMKLVSKQVNLLKKKAEKDLFNMLHWIVFATCDPYSQVSQEANTFITNVFPKDKWEEIMKRLTEKIIKILEEILVSGESTILIPSKLMNNDEDDCKEKRMNRLSEQSYGVLVTIIKGEKREEAQNILRHKLSNIKKNEMTRGLLNAVYNCIDPVSIISSCSLFDRLLSLFSSSDQSSLLPLSSDLLLLYLTSTTIILNDNQKKKVENTLISFLKKCGVCEWNCIGVRLLPLFSSLCGMMDESSRPIFISNWFNAIQSNGILTKECILYIGDCIKYVLALLENPSPQEISTALSMIFFLISQCSSSDPFTLHSLIIWTIPRLNQSKIPYFLEEVLRKCVESLPSSRPLINSLLSLHSDHLFFAWKFLHSSGMQSLPIHLLQNAPDNVLISLNESMNLIERIEEMGDASLSPLYIRLSSLIPSSSLERDITLPYSPLIYAVLTSINDDSQFIQLAGQLSDIDDYVEELTKKELTLPITRLHKLMNENERKKIERKILSIDSSFQFLANVAVSSKFSDEFDREVAIRVVNGYLAKTFDETKGIYMSEASRSIVNRLDITSILRIITDHVINSSRPIKVSFFHSIATLLYDVIEHGMNILDESLFFPHVISLLSCANEELTHYSLLSHFWPCCNELPYGPDPSSNLSIIMGRLNKMLALFLALYVHRSSDCSSSILLLSITMLSSSIKLARSYPLSFIAPSETENELLSYSNEMIENGGEFVKSEDVVSLLSYSTPISRPLIIYSLRPLTQSLKIGSLPYEADTPFSSLPTQSFNLHLEMARQLYYGRNVDIALETILSHSQLEGTPSNDQLFTLECDEAHFSLSISALTGANELMSGKRYGELERERDDDSRRSFSDPVIDFLRCAIVTALNSVDCYCPSQSKWEEGRRRLLAAASIQLAIRMNEMRAEEWVHFFLPSITPIILKIYGEIDVVDGSCLSRMVNIFISSHPSLEWNQSWNGQCDKKSFRYNMEMDEAGIPSAIQTMVVRAQNALERANEDKGEVIVAASILIGMCASFTISFSKDEENGIKVVLPPFMKSLASQDGDGWSRCAVLVAAIKLIDSEGKKEQEKDKKGAEKSIICDAMAPIITKCLTTIVSKTEHNSQHINSRYYIDKAIPSNDYLLHWLAYLLRETFSTFPSIVKMWYTALPKSAATLVNGFVCCHLSSILIDDEITQVMEGNLQEKYKNDQATLTIRRHANEILLDYILEDTRMRLCIKMPIGWPLIAPFVSVEGSIVGVEDGRKWMLQLNTQLHRNASVLSALSAWLIHAGKKVEGADSCTICMMLVAPTTKQLPKARCRTCHNKFHSSCLYKWFESSNQSQCPLCRADFTAPP